MYRDAVVGILVVRKIALAKGLILLLSMFRDYDFVAFFKMSYLM